MTGTDQTVSRRFYQEPVVYVAAGLWLAGLISARYYEVPWLAALTIAFLLSSLVFQVGTALNLRKIGRLRRGDR
jgi:hypothetical protein